MTTLDLNKTHFTLYDTDLISGWMYFQAELFLEDGTSLKSDVSSVFIESKWEAVLFPNPVTNDSDLTVVAEGGGLKFKIFDYQGRLLSSHDLDLRIEQFDVSKLIPGLYMFQLENSSNDVIDSGRFVKL